MGDGDTRELHYLVGVEMTSERFPSFRAALDGEQMWAMIHRGMTEAQGWQLNGVDLGDGHIFDIDLYADLAVVYAWPGTDVVERVLRALRSVCGDGVREDPEWIADCTPREAALVITAHYRCPYCRHEWTETDTGSIDTSGGMCPRCSMPVWSGVVTAGAEGEGECGS